MNYVARQRSDIEIGDKKIGNFYSNDIKLKWLAMEVLQKIDSEREAHSHAKQLKESITFLTENNPLLGIFQMNLLLAHNEIISEAEADDKRRSRNAARSLIEMICQHSCSTSSS